MKKRWVILMFSLCILAFSSSNTFSQTFTEISGTVKHRGAVISGVNVGVSNISGTLNRVTVTDNNGFYIFSMLPVDRYIVRVVFSGFREKRFEVNTGTGATSVLDIELDDGSLDTLNSIGSITGKVTDKDDNIIKGIKLSYAKKDSLQDKNDVKIDDEGKFNIAELAEGKYILFFEADGFESKKKEIKVKNKEKRINIKLKRK